MVFPLQGIPAIIPTLPHGGINLCSGTGTLAISSFGCSGVNKLDFFLTRRSGDILSAELNIAFAPLSKSELFGFHVWQPCSQCNFDTIY